MEMLEIQISEDNQLHQIKSLEGIKEVAQDQKTSNGYTVM